MDRLIAPNSVAFANRDIAPASGTPQYATDGNPGITAATIWPAYAFNMIQDEIMAVISAAGITPDGTNWTQLLQAIFSLPGKRSQTFASSGNFTVPAGVTKVKVTVTGGGGGGSPSNNGPPATGSTDTSGGGGGAGGTAIKICSVTPGQVVAVTVGTGGASSGNGTSSSFGAFCQASAGTGAAFIGVSVSPGGSPGVGTGGDTNLSGGYGSDGQASTAAGFGNGGSSYWGGGSRAYAAGNSPLAPAAPGSGGGGCYNGVGNGSVGAAGIVVVEW